MMIKKCIAGIAVWSIALIMLLPVYAGPDRSEQAPNVPESKPACGKGLTTICTIEIWLAHKHKNNNKAIRQTLKEKSIKVLRHTIQYWKPKGGHPPTNIAIGSRLNAEDARWVIELALILNDNIDGLIFQALNPPNYVAIATSAWDDLSETKITPDELERLRDPNLTTEEFHKLYKELTKEKDMPGRFY